MKKLPLEFLVFFITFFFLLPNSQLQQIALQSIETVQAFETNKSKGIQFVQVLDLDCLLKR
jgi:hypothetical protein